MKIDIQMNYDEKGRIDNMLFERVDDKNNPDYQFENVTIEVAELLQSLNKKTGEIVKDRPSVWNMEAMMPNKYGHKRVVFGGESDAIGEAISTLLTKNGEQS